MFVDRGTMHLLLPVLLVLLASCWTPTGARVIQKRAAFYIANDTMCIVDGDVFYNGNPVPTDDECERCTCRPPGFSCVLRDCDTKPGCKAVRRAGECCPEYVCGCVHNNRVYEDGEVIRDLQNACYTCRCHGSSISCTFAECLFRGDCPPEYVPGECCPRYDHCPPPRTTSTTAPSTVFTPESSTHPHIIQQEEQFLNLTTQHLEKFTDQDTTVRVEDVQHSITARFTTPTYDTSTLPTVTVKFTLTDGPISSIADFDLTSLSSVLPLQTATYTETTRYALPDEAHGGLSTTQESSSFADHNTSPSSADIITDSSTIDRSASSSAIEDIFSERTTIDYSAPSSSQPDVSTESSLDVSTPLPTESTTAHYETSSSSSLDVSSGSSFIDYDTSSTSTASDSEETTTAHYETSSSSSLDVSTDSHLNESDAYSSFTTSDKSESTTTYDTTSAGTSSVSLESFSVDLHSTFTGASASSEATVVDYKSASSTTLENSSESSFPDNSIQTSTSTGVSSDDTVLDNKAHFSEKLDVSTDSSSIDYDASTTIASSEETTVDKEATFSVTADTSPEEISTFDHKSSSFSTDSSSSEGTTIYHEEHSTTSSYSSESTTVAYDTSSYFTPSASSESLSTDKDIFSYSTSDISSESSTIDHDSSSTFTSDASTKDPAVDNEAYLISTPKVSPEKSEQDSTSTVIPIDETSASETHADLQTEESIDVRGASADKYTTPGTESFLNYTSTGVDVSTEYSPISTSHSTALISDDNATKVTQEYEETSTFSSVNEYKPSTVEGKNKWSYAENNLTDDLTESHSNETASVSDVDDFSFSTSAPYKDGINITETHSSSTTQINLEISTSTEHETDVSSTEHVTDVSSTEHVTDVSSTEHVIDVSSTEHVIDVSSTEHVTDVSSTEHVTDISSTEHVTDVSSTVTITGYHSSVETFYSEVALTTSKATEFSEIGSATQESISTDDDIINAESDQANKVEILPNFVNNASNATEELSTNYTDEPFESSGYTGDNFSFGIHKGTFTTEQPSEVLDVKSITESQAINGTSTYDAPQTTDQSLYSTSEFAITASTESSEEATDKSTPPVTTVESNNASESGIVTHVSLQKLTTQAYSEKDNIRESTTTETVESFDSKTTVHIHKYSTELPSTEIVTEFPSVSETSSSKSVNELPTTVSVADFSLEHDKSASLLEAVEFNVKSETTTEFTKGASTETDQNIDVTQIANETDMDELNNNESEIEKHLNISSHFEESSSIQPEGTDDTLDVKTTSFPGQPISTSTISQNITNELQFEGGIFNTTHINENNPIEESEEQVSNESIVKLHGDDVHTTKSTTSELYDEKTNTDAIDITSTFKTTSEDYLNTTPLPIENGSKYLLNESYNTPFANLIALEIEEILNKHFNISIRKPSAPQTNLSNNLEGSNASGKPDVESIADYIKVSTTERFDDRTHYTTEGQTINLEDVDTLYSKSSPSVNEDLNEKTETVLVTLHPLKTDLSGLLSVNNKQPQTTALYSTTEGTNENNSEDATKPFFVNQTEYEWIETSTSDLDETASHVFHANLEEVSNHASAESFSWEDVDKITTPEELVGDNTENVYFDTHNYSFPLITSGIPGEGLFTKYAQFHDFSESSSLTNNPVTEFTETESEEGEQKATETNAIEKKPNDAKPSTDSTLYYEVADAEVIPVSDVSNNNSTQDENSSVLLTEDTKDTSNKTSVEYNDLDTKMSSTTEKDASEYVSHETALLSNEQDARDSNSAPTNGTTIKQDIASFAPDNSISVSEDRNTTFHEFDDYSALDAEEDNMNDTLVSQQMNGGSEKTFVSVKNNDTSEEELKPSDFLAETSALEDSEGVTKIANDSSDLEFLTSEDTKSQDEEIGSVVKKEDIFSPNTYHAEETKADDHTTEATEYTSLESELTKIPLTTYSPPKENNAEEALYTQESYINASSTYLTSTQNSEETHPPTTTTENTFSTSSAQTFESTELSISPSQTAAGAILNILPENVKIHSDISQNSTISDIDNGADGSLEENTKFPSNSEQDYFSKTSTTIQEKEKVSEENQFTEESLPQRETVSIDSNKITDSGQTTVSEILETQSTTTGSGSATDDQSNSEFLTYNNHRAKEPELVSVHSSETANTNHVNILFGQTTDHFATSEKTQLDSVTPVLESQSQTERNEVAETYFTVDENNYGIALHEIGDPQNIKPATVDSTSVEKTTENVEINSQDDSLYENEYDHKEEINDLNSKSQAEENSSATASANTESSEKVEVGSPTTPSLDHFSVIGYLGDLFSGINVYSSSASTDITQTENVNSSQENPDERRENTEYPPVDTINAVESKPEQSVDVNFSSSGGASAENLVTEMNNEEKSDVASSTERESQTDPTSVFQSTQEILGDEILEFSYTTHKGLEETENPIPNSYISSLNFSIEKEDSKNENTQVSSDNRKTEENEGEILTDSIYAAKPNSVSDHANKPIEFHETTSFISTTSELLNSSEKGPEKGGNPIIPSISPLKHEAGEEEIPSSANAEGVTENAELINEINYATTLASYVLYRGKDNESTINVSEKVVSAETNSDNNDDITFDSTEGKETDFIPTKSHESVTSVLDVNKSHQVYYSNDGSFNNTPSKNTSLNSELPVEHERNDTAGGIANNTYRIQSFQPYSLFDVISNVFKAPGYDAEVHSTFLKEQAGISKKEKSVGVVKRDTNQRGERQISEIYEAAISDTKNTEPEPRRLQAMKVVSSEGFAFLPNSKTQQQQQQPAFASVTSSFIIVDRADDSSRSRRKIPIRNPGGDVQEIEVPASFNFPPSFRFPSRSATKSEEESHK